MNGNWKFSVFEKTFSGYLEQVNNLDPGSLRDRLGINLNEDEIAVSVLNRKYFISKKDVTDSSGKRPSFDICIIILKYLMTNRTGFPSVAEWCSYRDLRDSGPLTVYFRDNVEQAFSDYFSGNISTLKSACINIGGKRPEDNFTHDISMIFNFLPRVPLLLLFNDKDEEFPASCSLLFERRSENYLDAECLAMTGRVLFDEIRKE